MPLEVAFIGLLALGAKPPVLSVLPDRRTARAVERIRADDALASARRLYTASEFEQCTSVLVQAEARLRTVLSRRRDFELMKQINLWLGLCRAVAGDPEGASVAFARARRLPGPGPNPNLFPPPVMALIEDRSEVPTCEIKIDARLIDGKRGARSRRIQIQIGEHYAAGNRRGRFTVDDDCRVSWEIDTAPPAGVVTPREAADPEFLGRLERHGLSVTTEPKRREQAIESPWYQEHWWIWVVAGVVAVGVAVPTTYVLARDRDRYTLSFSP